MMRLELNSGNTLQATADLITIQSRHCQIEQDDIRHVLPNTFQCTLAAACFAHRVKWVEHRTNRTRMSAASSTIKTCGSMVVLMRKLTSGVNAIGYRGQSSRTGRA